MKIKSSICTYLSYFINDQKDTCAVKSLNFDNLNFACRKIIRISIYIDISEQ